MIIVIHLNGGVGEYKPLSNDNNTRSRIPAQRGEEYRWRNGLSVVTNGYRVGEEYLVEKSPS